MENSLYPILGDPPFSWENKYILYQCGMSRFGPGAIPVQDKLHECFNPLV